MGKIWRLNVTLQDNESFCLFFKDRGLTLFEGSTPEKAKRFSRRVEGRQKEGPDLGEGPIPGGFRLWLT